MKEINGTIYNTRTAAMNIFIVYNKLFQRFFQDIYLLFYLINFIIF